MQLRFPNETYKKILNEKGDLGSIQRESDKAFIPMDPMNRDYQELMKFLESKKMKLDDIVIREK